MPGMMSVALIHCTEMKALADSEETVMIPVQCIFLACGMARSHPGVPFPTLNSDHLGRVGVEPLRDIVCMLCISYVETVEHSLAPGLFPRHL